MHKPVRISASTLKSWMDNPQQPFVVIDVRDHDTFGSPINSFFQGHIRHSINVPAANFVPSLPSLSSSLCNTKRVVFHCQLSQSRGPACATAYSRHISHIFPHQEIYILDGGFNEWARLYGRDARYTEAL
ncbi:similar to Saccharomyces cerevisiae YPR200C ARR2 Arsenate reductase required for arsenate resistance [Geotrichum candidum]|uniref:Similar to Saccharomyces cerevisiae YPR200C ARR2 Arsenate reductase required for arsenate resistance n=1 Tax=Geotrichum candidum TaxID=1173061 RepID=A0A0J9XCR9_GEOCN|nr:similar to Saccharomyces cerevisiae YPR200C ARR2 Arsenate reductase required for arsenate resistance [Geotrichum candidum]